MPYRAAVSTRSPCCLFFLLNLSDTSASYSDIELINDLLTDTILRCSSGERIRDWYEIGVLGYHIEQQGKILFNTLLASPQIIQPISAIDKTPITVEDKEVSYPDGAGGKVTMSVMRPVWIMKDKLFKKDYAIDFEMVTSALAKWASLRENSLPPIIVNLSNSQSHSPSIFKPFQNIRTQDGEALVFYRTDNMPNGNNGNLEQFLNDSTLLPRIVDISPRFVEGNQKTRTSSNVFKIGSNVGNYTILEKLGEGGIGTVYKARHKLLNQIAAIKVNEFFPPDGVVGKAFLQAANYLSQLNHPNIVKLYDYGFQFNQAYMVIEFIEGYSLSELIPKRQTEDWTRRAVNIFVQLLSAIRYAHNCIYLNSDGYKVAGIIHGDIKPQNILVDKEGLAKLSDFMIPDVQLYFGKEISSFNEITATYGSPFTPSEKELIVQQITGLGTRAYGSPAYMPPEQWGGKVSVRTDIFTLGATFYEMLTGHPPMGLFSGAMPRQANPFVAKWMEDFIIKAMSPNPLERYDSVSEIENLFQENVTKRESEYTKFSIKELIMGDKTEIRNTGTISNSGGQMFIGKFNDVMANLNTAGKTEFAEALKTLKEAVMNSSHILDEEKQEHVEIINKIGEEAVKDKPNKILLKTMGEGLLSILKAIPDVAKAVTVVAPFLTHMP